TVLITGGTRGIGKELALKFLSEGYNVAVTYLNSDNHAKQLYNKGIFTVKADCANYELAKTVIDEVVNYFGNISVLINNAGIAPKQKLLLDVSENEFDSVISTNLKGVFNYSKFAVEKMLAEGGVICNVSSVQGFDGGSCEVVYSASKSGVIGFTRALANELHESDISVFGVAPTLTDTDMNAHLTDEEKLEFLAEAGVKEIPSAKSVAQTIYTLIQNAKVYHGETINISKKL
ncbi:MAG: SDR family oxidoreductase, partial [Clostridia bacterium]|nr:SDR family oxidoreductase [Clostridia bacterium]